MSVADDLKEIFSKMPGAFRPEKATDVNAIIQLNLSGDGGGNWHIKIAGGELSAGEGEAALARFDLEHGCQRLYRP